MNLNPITQKPNDVTLDEADCWRMMLARDAHADGTFVYAVRSTGIYCRPSCPSRRPQREQVTFFRQPAAAEAAGFRPCQRCHPQHAAAPEPQAEWIPKLCHYIETHLDEPLSLAVLGAQVYLSPYHLQRTFKRIIGMTPRQYAESCRLGHLKTQLQSGEAVTRALYNAGYRSSSSMYERAPLQLGMTPTAYRQGGKGMQIRYAIVASPLGWVLVAATERGVAAARFGDSAAALEAELVQEYPAAEIKRDEASIRPWVTPLLHHLQGHPAPLTVPLDVQATAFQWKVWEALRTIPIGSTRSYRAIAQAIGQPTAARAVAHACATNPVALFIPCHRVVRENGQLGGYRWGLERKRTLLALEQISANADAGDRAATSQLHLSQQTAAISERKKANT
jgi:AraC family transcriptional regulator of adaptative response/methylated-DNA-[protein]-cysteine methyltransferase